LKKSDFERTAAGWRKYDADEVRLTRPVSERMLDLGKLKPGMRVLDVACGRGEPAILAARRVGADGFVLGLELAEGILEMARERARREGVTNIEFRCADAEELTVDSPFEIATLRWGLMYMRDPQRALENIRRALEPGSLLVLASWVEPARVPYADLPLRTLARFRDVPPIEADAPGTHRHADPVALEALLERAGFVAQRHEEMEIPVMEGADGRAFVRRIYDMKGPLAALVAEMPEEKQRAWEDAFAEEVERYRVGDVVPLGGVTRITVARRRL
jgi:SAM-dependent methyltransferase